MPRVRSHKIISQARHSASPPTRLGALPGQLRIEGWRRPAMICQQQVAQGEGGNLLRGGGLLSDLSLVILPWCPPRRAELRGELAEVRLLCSWRGRLWRGRGRTVRRRRQIWRQRQRWSWIRGRPRWRALWRPGRGLRQLRQRPGRRLRGVCGHGPRARRGHGQRLLRQLRGNTACDQRAPPDGAWGRGSGCGGRGSWSGCWC